jgi:hypothetical protein
MAKKVIGAIYLMVPKDICNGKMLAACVDNSGFVWSAEDEVNSYRQEGYERLTKLKFM